MTLPIAMQAAGSAMQGISGIFSSAYQAQIARNNARIAQQNEAYAASAGAANTERAGLKAAAELSGTRAKLAAENVDVNKGSAADTQVSQREIGALDQATVANNAALQAYGYRTQWANFENQAHMKDASAVMSGLKAAVGVGRDLANLPNAPVASAQGDVNATGIDTSVDASTLSGPMELPEDFAWMMG